MRKRFIMMIVFVSLSLLGCDGAPFNLGRPACKDGSYRSGDECVVFDGDLLAADGAVRVVDRASDYEIAESDLPLYRYGVDLGTAYVDVEEFLAAMDEGIAAHSVRITDNITVVVAGGSPFRPIKLTLDPGDNELRYSDFDFDGAMSGPMSFEYDTDLVPVGYEVTGGEAAKTIPLDPYGIAIVRDDGHFYVPLFLANLLFTGGALNVYRIGETLYVVDDYDNIAGDLGDPSFETVANQTAMVEDSAQCAALLFDHYYGLKPDAGTSYLELFQQRHIFGAATIGEFDTRFTSFLYSLDDIHTSVLDYGFGRDTFQPSSPSEDSRYYRFIRALLDGETLDRTVGIDLREYDTYYILEINEFDLETKDLLSDLLPGVDPDKDIVIDLSCNTGGSLIAVVELLTYLTDEPIPLNYKNPTTGLFESVDYVAGEPRALPNRFFVYTSTVTFSAANLFASIVRDLNLGFVFGLPTSGGAAAVDTIVLPNNLILAYSSNMLFLNEDGESIELGIEPDWEISAPDAETAADRILHRFAEETGLSVEDSSTAGTIAFTLTTDSIPDDISLRGYRIVVEDGVTGRQIASYESYEPSFDFEEEVVNPPDLVRLKIYAVYEIGAHSFHELVYLSMADTFLDEFGAGTGEVEIGVPCQTNLYGAEDVDFVKIVVAEPGLYRIYVDGNYVIPSHVLYDEMGTLIGQGSDFALDPGVYYVRIDIHTSIGKKDYTILVERMDDDNAHETHVTLADGTISATLQFDYPDDREWIRLTVPADALVSIDGGDTATEFYAIRTLDDRLYRSDSGTLDPQATYHVVLAAGDYLIAFVDDPEVNDVTFTFTTTVLTDDYAGGLGEPDERYGILAGGTLPVVVDGRWDSDIYRFETAYDAVVTFDHTAYLSACLVLPSANPVCKDDGELYELSPGVHYFRFTSEPRLAPYTIDVDVRISVDQSSLDQKIPIAVGDTFPAVVEFEGDLDYFTFTLDALTTLRLRLDAGSGAGVKIYDATDHYLVNVSLGDAIFQLPAGAYLLEVGQSRTIPKAGRDFVITLLSYASADTDTGVYGMAASYYRIATLPAMLSVVYSGRIDYVADNDLFLIEVTVAGIYGIHFTYEDDCYLMMVNPAFTQTAALENGGTMFYEVGTYCLFVRAIHSGDASYSFSFYIPE